MNPPYYATRRPSPVGELTLASDGQNLVGLWIAGQKYYLGSLPAKPVNDDSLPIFAAAGLWLEAYFAGKRPSPGELPLSPIGGAFRQRVWQMLLSIPYGEVRTYGGIARQLALETGKATLSAQAVGGAVGHNPISLIIPCHRVVGAKGQLTGYAAGLEIKAKLLTFEGADRERLLIPGRR
ncbi:MAG: methylated-DNA--[protein]-cysteine S-methyltransferase [Tannerella sp.]|jgi:methylated-DNA-[protein]-cysteine S-methyltransferase|nr:methylated-DNA--[protein]-cysteine S-methyltransferase [Tannerella sp.]